MAMLTWLFITSYFLPEAELLGYIEVWKTTAETNNSKCSLSVQQIEVTSGRLQRAQRGLIVFFTQFMTTRSRRKNRKWKQCGHNAYGTYTIVFQSVADLECNCSGYTRLTIQRTRNKIQNLNSYFN
jgi:hypothetical protein